MSGDQCQSVRPTRTERPQRRGMIYVSSAPMCGSLKGGGDAAFTELIEEEFVFHFPLT